MNLAEYFSCLAGYNRIANERIYECCARLDPGEYRKSRQVSFGSIHALLNHMLLGDRIWMSRFRGGGAVTPPLNTVLFDDFAGLRSARVSEDAGIEAFFSAPDPAFFERSLSYRNSQGRDCVDVAATAVGHFFNHQTHHRGQVHTLLAQAGIAPPSLDLHRVLNP